MCVGESSHFNNVWIEVYPDKAGNQVREDGQGTFYEAIKGSLLGRFRRCVLFIIDPLEPGLFQDKGLQLRQDIFMFH